MSVRVAPEAVREARQAVAEHLPKVGIAADSAFADVVLLVASELVANVIRHAAHTSVAGVGIAVGAGQLVIAVSDGDPRLPCLAADARGEGLRMVSELAALYDGDVSAEPAVDHDGKVVLVRFRIPYPAIPGDARPGVMT
ncbi:ATP-binding protein [Streptomyces sp. NBC_01750]|uniref:ATP-binding protein n=1 Tax=Streptomyces sp. NBC_01750 TaxID=2975928 RepID=UPI002DD92B8B|nr:ATP-binding protein [Streptomyces sp. NBC_01750]WSD37526.1 ATP-binding protein [Streptomyces sp. NBC_01750]